MTDMAATTGYWRMRPARIAKAVCALIAAVASACGGGGDATPSDVASPVVPSRGVASPSPVVHGEEEPTAIYGAAISGFSSPDMVYIYLGSGQQLAVIGQFGDAGFLVEDVITVTSGIAVLAAEPGVAYNSIAWRTGTNYAINARAEQSSISGRMASKGVTWEFSGSSVRHSSYRFNRPADLTAVTGAWALTDVYGESLRIEIDDTGAISGTYLGCALSGIAQPSSSQDYLKAAIRLLGSCEAEVPVPYSGFLAAFELDSGRTQLFLFGFAAWGAMDGAAVFASGAR